VANFGKRYELIERIGSGGTGEVWLAHDERLGSRPVAIKIMHKHVLASSGDADRFEREMRLAAMLDHPNIVTIYTTGTYDDAPFVVMEYLEGHDLDMALPGGDPERVAAIGRDICGALAYAHGEGVVHGDIKPGNVVLCDSGQVKVTDFGTARAVSGTTLESPGAQDGMLTYLSPGQWRGEAPDVSDDIWSAGCLLYRLLSGRLPRVLPGAADYTAAARRGDPVPDLRHISTAPDWLTSTVMAMLDPDPAGRATADDCVRLLSGTPSRASVPGWVLSSRLLPSQDGPGPHAPGSVSMTAPIAADTTAGRWRRPGRVVSAIAVAVVVLLAGSITAWRFGTASRTPGSTLSSVVTHPTGTGAAAVTAPATSAAASRSSSAEAALPSASTSLSGFPAASSSRSPSVSPSLPRFASPSASSPSFPAPSPSSSPAPSSPSSPSGVPSSPPATSPSSTPTASPTASAPPSPGSPLPGSPPPCGPPPGASPPPGGPPPWCPPS
jgi:serine/threonine protein kinase